MRLTIERVRVAVVAGAAAIALIVFGFLAMAHFRAHRLLRDLPARLGADIQKETNGFTWSQSVKGRTVFTIHAAKATQHKDGLTGLEDVGIVLYGQKEGRADRIYGKQFEYDQKNGVVRARGEVQLDLQAPAPVGATARAEYARGGAMQPAQKDAEMQPIHVVTSGLVFTQSEGVAETDQPIRFEYRGMTGQARGAVYDSRTGLTTLESEVRISALKDGRPTVLTASHAQLDRVTHRLLLRHAHYVSLPDGAGTAAETDTMTAGEVTVHLREDGGVEDVEAAGGVELASGGSRMQAPRGAVRISEAGQPVAAHMEGGVRFLSEEERPREGLATGAVEGGAVAADARFGTKGGVEAVELVGDVRAVSRGRGGERQMSGGAVTLRLGQAGTGGRRYVQQATLREGAAVQSTIAASGGHAAGREAVRAEVLVARWEPARGGAELREVSGEGKTVLERRRDGAEEVSRGDRLQATFVAAEAARTGAAGSGVSLASAVQTGAVSIVRTERRGSEAPEETRATADRASYDGVSGQVRLAGSATVRDESSELRADKVTLKEATGDAEANGAVQVSYRRPEGAADRPGQEAMHVVAERAVSRKQSGLTTFYGAAGGRARLWQGASQVEAPVLVFGQKQGTLEAHGAGAEGVPGAVRTVLVARAGANGRGAPPQKQSGPEILRIQSATMSYTDGERRATFDGGVLLMDAEGSMSSREAVAVIAARPEGGADRGPRSRAEGLLGGGSGVERVTATGGVTIRQPGRVATGSEAVYTASDDVFVLTGKEGALPKVTDEANGSVTGAALRFRAGDDSVTVEGRAAETVSPVKDGPARTADGRVHTRTRVKQ